MKNILKYIQEYFFFLKWNLQNLLIIQQTCVEAAPVLQAYRN
jgi:hypothetical protein